MSHGSFPHTAGLGRHLSSTCCSVASEPHLVLIQVLADIFSPAVELPRLSPEQPSLRTMQKVLLLILRWLLSMAVMLLPYLLLASMTLACVCCWTVCLHVALL